MTSAFVKEALDKGAEIFKWEEKKARSGKRVGTKARGSGVAVSTYSAGSIGFDGLLIIRPDGKVQIQSGIGNLGTHAVFDVHRVAADILGVPWEQCEVVWGNTSKNLPWTCSSGGSQTAHAMTRAAHAVGTARARSCCRKSPRRRSAAIPASYQVADGRVFGGGRSMTFAQAAQKAIELGGKYDGHEPPEDVNNWTKTSMKNLAGPGSDRRRARQLPARRPVALVRRRLRRSRSRRRDRRTSRSSSTRRSPTSARCMQPAQPAGPDLRRLDARHRPRHRRRSGSTTSTTACRSPSGSTTTSRRRFSTGRATFTYAALDIPDPETPVGVRGIGEPPVGAGCGAVLNAIAAAVGDEVFRRMPVTAGHDSDGARSGPAGARSVDGEYLG